MDALTKKRDVSFPLFEIDIFAAKQKDLEEISEVMGLNLSLEEMNAVRNYFQTKGRMPTDVEIQSIAQAWSEHCCYKSSKIFLKEHIFTIKNDDVLAKGDAGVMVFDDEHAYALRIESHNHPSAIEPYGGAATGIGGIVRDVLAMGAQPIALIDPLFFGPIDYKGEVPPGTKHPHYLTTGVIAGIRDYGNRIGIPTVSGGVFFDDHYVGNCLVNVGCVGFLRRDRLLQNAVKGVGDVLILVGGRTGRDGIHGVTFASAILTEASEEESRGAVQLGDPIMKEPLIHACLEVNERGLISGMKDLGGGGLSCVVGEIALAGGCGAEVFLDRVPLKEQGLAPWEIWVSESQERMMLAAPEKNVQKIKEIFDLWDVPATVVGRVIQEKKVKLYFDGATVFDLELEFLTKGPEYCRPCAASKSLKKEEERLPPLPKDLTSTLLELLGDPNIASKDWIIKLYDHQVRGSTVLTPLQGKVGSRGPGDASVMKPRVDSYRGLAITVGVNPWYTAADPYRGGMSAVDEICRNLTAVGAVPHSLTNCLNFGNPEKPERLWEFREAVRGLGEVSRAMNIAIPSGNVSFYNESAKDAALPTPTVMGVGIVEDIRKCVTIDLKREGDPLFLVGETKREMGASALFRKFQGKGGDVPEVDIALLKKSMKTVKDTIDQGMVAACHDCSDGGLVVALAEMCIAGDMGMKIELGGLGTLPSLVKLFSESNSRFVVEIKKEREKEFTSLAGDLAKKIGTTGGRSLTIDDRERVVDARVEVLRKAWHSPLWDLLGGAE